MTDDDPARLPIDSGEPMATQSRQTLMIGPDRDLLHFDRPVNMSNPAHVAQLRAELGADADLPTDGGTYYLADIESEQDGLITVLIPEGDARAVAWALGCKRSKADAAALQYRQGTLPV
jgi:hypothetical protein